MFQYKGHHHQRPLFCFSSWAITKMFLIISSRVATERPSILYTLYTCILKAPLAFLYTKALRISLLALTYLLCLMCLRWRINCQGDSIFNIMSYDLKELYLALNYGSLLVGYIDDFVITIVYSARVPGPRPALSRRWTRVNSTWRNLSYISQPKLVFLATKWFVCCGK